MSFLLEEILINCSLSFGREDSNKSRPKSKLNKGYKFVCKFKFNAKPSFAGVSINLKTGTVVVLPNLNFKSGRHFATPQGGPCEPCTAGLYATVHFFIVNCLIKSRLKAIFKINLENVISIKICNYADKHEFTFRIIIVEWYRNIFVHNDLCVYGTGLSTGTGQCQCGWPAYTGNISLKTSDHCKMLHLIYSCETYGGLKIRKLLNKVVKGRRIVDDELMRYQRVKVNDKETTSMVSLKVFIYLFQNGQQTAGTIHEWYVWRILLLVLMAISEGLSSYLCPPALLVQLIVRNLLVIITTVSLVFAIFNGRS